MNKPRNNQQKTEISLEQQLARVFGLGLSAAIFFLGIGIFIPAVLWLGIAALMLVPMAGAVLVWRDSSIERSTRFNIGLAFFGVMMAVLIGLFLRR